jgi:hypothetical protein
MLTDERIKQMRADAISDPRNAQEFWYMLMARAIESEATAPLLARIAELEKELAFTSEMNDQLREQLEADTKRLGFVEVRLFGKSWNGVIDSGSRTDWRIASDHRHITQKMVGHTFRDALDNAMEEQP